MAPSRRRYSGKFPECGAIFMSNTETRRECFQRSLFSLPRASAAFVRNVKKGMILFLFDYQQKKLFGVFEALSDGGLNIDPHAFSSSQRAFPAQVRFRVIWKCSPLHQREFRDAIRDNYYGEHRFNFGLSKDQVWRLLYLFKFRVKIQKSPIERKVKHSDRSREKKSVDNSSCEPLELGELRPSFESRVRIQRCQMAKKIKHSGHSSEKKSVDVSPCEPLKPGEFMPSFESRVRIQKYPTEKKIKHSDHSSEKKSVDTSCEPLELGEFILSPESRVRSQKSPMERKIKQSSAHSSEKKSVDISSCETLEPGKFVPSFESKLRLQKFPTETKIKHSDHLNEKKSVDISSCEPLELGEFRPLFESRVTIQKSPTERKINDHSDHSNEKMSVNISSCEPLELREFMPSFESKVGIQKSPAERNIKHSDHSSEKKSVDITSCVPLELGEFIPLFSPGSFGSSCSQSSPGRSKNQDFPEYYLKVKGMYADRIEDKKSAFARLEEGEKYTMEETKGSTGHLDIHATVYHGKNLEIESRTYADVKTIKEIMENLLQRQKSWKKNQTGRNHGLRKIETHRVANILSCSKFNPERNKEKETSQEKEQKRDRDGCDNYYGRGADREMVGKRCNYSPVGRWLSDNQQKKRKSKEKEQKRDRGGRDKYYGRGVDRENGGENRNYSPVSSCLFDMQQKKRKLAVQIPSVEIEQDGVCESYLDDQAEYCENSIVSIVSESDQLSPSNMPFKFDAMRYLESICEQNQGPEKCEEKDMLLSWKSEMFEIFDNYKRFLEDMAAVVSSLGAGSGSLAI